MPRENRKPFLKTLATAALLASSSVKMPPHGKSQKSYESSSTTIAVANTSRNKSDRRHQALMTTKEAERSRKLENLLRPNAMSKALEESSSGDLINIHDGLSNEKALGELLMHVDDGEDKYVIKKPRKLGKGVLGAVYFITTAKDKAPEFIQLLLDCVQRDHQARRKRKHNNLVISDKQFWGPGIKDNFVIKVSEPGSGYGLISAYNFVDNLEKISRAPKFSFDTTHCTSMPERFRGAFQLRAQDFVPSLVAGFAFDSAPKFHFTLMEAVNGITIYQFYNVLKKQDQSTVGLPEGKAMLAGLLKKAHLSLMLSVGMIHNDLHLNNMMVRIRYANGFPIISIVIIDLSEARLSRDVRDFARKAFNEALQTIDFDYLSRSTYWTSNDLPFEFYSKVHDFVIAKLRSISNSNGNYSNQYRRDLSKAAENSKHFPLLEKM
jgi:hypothetical protein